MNIFQKIFHGAVEAKDLAVAAAEKLPKVITLCKDVKGDLSTVVPETSILVGDVENIVTLGGQDAVQFLAASKVIWPALAAAVAADGEDLVLDAAILAQIKPIIASGAKFANTVPLFEKLFTDYGTFQSSLKVDLTKIDADAKAVFAPIVPAAPAALSAVPVAKPATV